jgi:hypothetical protein
MIRPPFPPDPPHIAGFSSTRVRSSPLPLILLGEWPSFCLDELQPISVSKFKINCQTINLLKMKLSKVARFSQSLIKSEHTQTTLVASQISKKSEDTKTSSLERLDDKYFNENALTHGEFDPIDNLSPTFAKKVERSFDSLFFTQETIVHQP